jgi:hypothetical protein
LLSKYPQYKVLQIEGTSDALVSLPGVWDLIKKRKEYLKVKGQWTPLIKDGDIFGYTKDYGRYKLMTVHGQGHYGPLEKYEGVYKAIDNFINDRPLNTNFE